MSELLWFLFPDWMARRLLRKALIEKYGSFEAGVKALKDAGNPTRRGGA